MRIMAPSVWGLLAGLAGLAGYIPYLRDSWRRTSDPDPAAWLVWTIEYGILLAAQAAQHPPWAALSFAVLQLTGTVLVSAVLVLRGGWRFGAGRWAVLGGAAAAMGLWWLTRSPVLAMCLGLATEGAGMVLVILGAYRSPGRETVLTWYIFVSAALLDLPALRRAPPLMYAYPAFFIVMGGGVLVASAVGAREGRAARARSRRAGRAPAGASLPRNTA